VKTEPEGHVSVCKVVVNLRDGSTREIIEHIAYPQNSLADAITKLTVTDETDPNLLRDWEKTYNIHAPVLMKKPQVRTPVPQKPPKREPIKRAYDRSREKREVRKEHTRSEGRED